jgi:3-oxoacyl-(acyl-carrier-protein) synthase
MAAVLTLQSNIIHPTINYEEPDPLCDLDYVPNSARVFTGTHALILSSGFSGTHATLVIKKAEENV